MSTSAPQTNPTERILLGPGPSTVPALARARPVSRQHIQVLVNRLLELGLVETRKNPAHERSSLVALTRAGARRFETMHRSEGHALDGAKFPVSEARMNAAAETLRRTREFLASRFADGAR